MDVVQQVAENVQDVVANVSQQADQVLDTLFGPNLDTPAAAILQVLLISYAALGAPKLPLGVAKLFQNFAFRLLVLFFILWTGNRNPGMSLTLAFAFLTVVNLASGKGPFESFEKVEQFEGPETAVIPSCLNMTTYDLLESFGNDKTKLMTAMLSSRVPQNLPINDLYAPLIATYLVNHGWTLKAPCGPPA